MIDRKEYDTDDSENDVTYFYIRANKFIPGSGKRNYYYQIDDEPINECLKLKPSTPTGSFSLTR